MQLVAATFMADDGGCIWIYAKKLCTEKKTYETLEGCGDASRLSSGILARTGLRSVDLAFSRVDRPQTCRAVRASDSRDARARLSQSE